MENLDDFYNYNPFGRGGGGAPLRDQFGNVITTRKPQHRNEFQRMHHLRKTDASVATRAATKHGFRNGLTASMPKSSYHGPAPGGGSNDQHTEDFFFGKQSVGPPP